MVPAFTFFHLPKVTNFDGSKVWPRQLTISVYDGYRAEKTSLCAFFRKQSSGPMFSQKFPQKNSQN
jgi:hypothetical protein